MDTETDNEPREPRYGTVTLLVAAGVVAAWVGNWVLVTELFTFGDDRAHFGEMFGAVNALFSGLAFAGVILAILLQRAELQLQSE